MRRVHESVDFITHPDRKVQKILDPNNMSMSNVPPLQSLTSVKIEGFSFVKKQNTIQYTVFKIRIVSDKQSWAVFRRYSAFVHLHEELSRQFDVPALPPKRLFGHFATDFLLKRQADLELWLKRVLFDSRRKVMPHYGVMKTFLTKDLVERAGLGMFEPSVVVSVPKPSMSTCSNTSYASPETKSTSTKKQDTSDDDIEPELPDHILSHETTVNRVDLDLDFETSNLNLSLNLNDNTNLRNENGQVKKPSMNDFEELKVLGKGSFGKVILCRKKDTKKLYAIKVLKKRHVLKKKQIRHAKTERSVLEYLDHPFIVKLHYAFQTGDKLHFVIDYMPGGELFFHLGRSGKFQEPLGRFYAAEIALALGHLHSHRVVYRDLKPENILLDADGHIKLADFGLSKEGIHSGTEGTHSFCGTPEYLAPEVLNRTGHGYAVDWWSLGALLYEMLTGLPPWYSQDRRKMFTAIKHSELRFPEVVSPGAKAILVALLERDAAVRLGSTDDVKEVQAHPFFANVEWEKLYNKEIPAPFVPQIASGSEYSSNPDTTNFDPSFTRLPVNSISEGPSSITSGASPSRFGQSVNSLANAFSGFTFVESSLLKEKVAEESQQADASDQMLNLNVNLDVPLQEKTEEQLLHEQILNLHDTILPTVNSSSPSGLSSSLMFQ